MKSKILVYGANGYMGKLFTKIALSQNLPLVLAARKDFITAIEKRIFSLENIPAIVEQLYDVCLVVNLAGPFQATNKPIIKACLQSKTHYIDIAGEVAELETTYAFNEAAIIAGIMLMPGAGFGVVPTDIAASLAAQKIENPTHLTIAYATQGGASRGTLKTVLKDINKPGVQLVNGKFTEAMPATSSFTFEHGSKKIKTVYNPWRADLFTARLTTKIQNISTYANFPGFVEKMMKGKLLWLRNLILNNLLFLLPEGPSQKQLAKGSTIIYAETTNAKKEKAVVLVNGPEAYQFTAQCLLAICNRVLAHNFQLGFQTGAIYGVALIEDIDKVTIS